MLRELIELTMLALASASVTWSITKSSLFRPVRERADGLHEMIGHLFGCPFCMAHWVTLVGLIFFPLSVVQYHPFVDFFIHWFATVTLTVIVIGIMDRLILFNEQIIKELVK